jgi:hypothetical protein
MNFEYVNTCDPPILRFFVGKVLGMRLTSYKLLLAVSTGNSVSGVSSVALFYASMTPLYTCTVQGEITCSGHLLRLKGNAPKCLTHSPQYLHDCTLLQICLKMPPWSFVFPDLFGSMLCRTYYRTSSVDKKRSIQELAIVNAMCKQAQQENTHTIVLEDPNSVIQSRGGYEL